MLAHDMGLGKTFQVLLPSLAPPPPASTTASSVAVSRKEDCYPRGRLAFSLHPLSYQLSLPLACALIGSRTCAPKQVIALVATVLGAGAELGVRTVLIVMPPNVLHNWEVRPPAARMHAWLSSSPAHATTVALFGRVDAGRV